MKININQMATVTLTVEGAVIYERYHKSLESPSYDYVFQPKKAGDEWRAELWKIMKVFGLHCGNGFPAFTVQCEIELENQT